MIIIGEIDELKEIVKNKKIYIYGSGVYGRTLCFFLMEQGIADIGGFVTTEKYIEDYVIDKRVHTLDEYKMFANLSCQLIIGVSGEYTADIARNVDNEAIENVLEINNVLWDYIIENTKFYNTIPKNNVAILMYHRINDCSNDFWKLNISRESFERQISYISRNYEVLRLDEDWLEKVNAQKKYLIITFDDGYVDNYRNAMPILEKYMIPATFFVSTNLIGTNYMFWWDELELFLIEDNYSGVFQYSDKEILIKNKEDREKVCKEVRNYLKTKLPNEIEEEMRRIRKNLHKERVSTDKLRCLSLEELRKLSESKYATIGGHTKSHLSMGEDKPYKLMADEVSGSLSILRTCSMCEITTFAFPFGADEDYCAMAEEILKENNIKRAVSAKPGNIVANSWGYNMPRHMMYNDDDIEHKLNRIWGIYG